MSILHSSIKSQQKLKNTLQQIIARHHYCDLTKWYDRLPSKEMDAIQCTLPFKLIVCLCVSSNTGVLYILYNIYIYTYIF